MADILTLASATQLKGDAAGKVAVIGSQGTAGPALWAARAGVRAVIFNDAGVGKDNAGITALAYCQKLGMAAACIDARSARMSDGEDMLARGVISYANELAQRVGVFAGQSCRDAAEALRSARQFSGEPSAADEPRRHLLAERNGIKVWGLDTGGLMTDEDAGHILLTGSHGGLVGGDPASANRGVMFRAIIHNDAGIGPDDSTASRLPVLDTLGVPAALVSAASARISDARSTYHDGVLSLVNDTARAAGGSPGMSAKDFVEKLLG